MQIQPPPEPPQPRPSERAPLDTHITQSRNTLPTTNKPYSPDKIDLPQLPEVIPTGDTFKVDPPKPTPSFAPVSAKPRGNPGAWVTPNDYPARDLREGNQGATGFVLAISASGRVQSCTVTRTSGFPSLDEATCRNLMRRARFDPATDGSGSPVASEYRNTIRWVIPD